MTTFNIADVARLHNLQVIRQNPNGEVQAICPFCGDKRGKFSYNVNKGVYGCFKCDSTGNALDLHIGLSPKDFGPAPECYKNAYKDLLQAFGDGSCETVAPVTVKNVEAERASDSVCDQTYNAMLSLLDLSNAHKADLLRRGFSEEAIKRLSFKDTPKNGYEIAQTLFKRGYILEGVPGFYKKNGRWTLNVAGKGYLCPVFNADGLVLGFQIRLDKPVGNAKYLWVSSAGREKGTSSGALSTILIGESKGVLLITEGILKAACIYEQLNNKITVIGVPGVKSLTHLSDVLKPYKGNAFVIEAFDMDKMETTEIKTLREEAVKRGVDILSESEHYRSLIKQQGIADAAQNLRAKLKKEFKMNSHSLVWDMKGDVWNGNLKGLDDFLVEVPCGEKLVAYVLSLAVKDARMKDFLKTP